MSKYDKERKALGLKPLGGSTGSTQPAGSKYAKERAALFAPPKEPQEDERVRMVSQMMPTPERFKQASVRKADEGPQLVSPSKVRVKATKDLPKKIQRQIKAHEADTSYSAGHTRAEDFVAGLGNTLTFGVLPAAMGQQDTAREASKTAAGKIGELAGYLLPGTAAERIASTAVKPLVRNAPRLVQNVARGAGAGAVFGAASEGAQAATGANEQTLGERIKDAALETAVGAGLPVAGKAIGSLTSKARGALDAFLNRSKSTPEVQQQVAEILALPEGRGTQRMNAAAERSKPLPDEGVVYGQGTVRNPEPLALPQGNYVRPQRLRVADAEQTLDSVMRKIKPEVEAEIAVPARRDQLINYIQRHLKVPVEEVWNMPMKDLQELGQLVRQNIDVPEVAFATARRHGHDLQSLLEGNAPTVSARVAQDARNRAYGVYPESLPNVQTPHLNKQVTGEAFAPQTRIGFNRPEPEVQVTAPQRKFAPTQSKYAEERAAIEQETPSKYAADRTAIQESEPQIPTDYVPFNELSDEGKAQRMLHAARINEAKDVAEMSREEYRDFLRYTGALDEQRGQTATVRETVTQPQTATQQPNERGFIKTLRESEKTPASLKERLKAAYEPITNQKVVDLANKRLENDLEAAASYVLGKSRLTAEKVTTAHRLIDEFIKQGNHERAVDIVEKIAEEGTRAGQSIQAFSIYNRLTPEGILIHAKRIANKTNESIPLGVKEVEVTPQIAAELTDLAATTQKMTGVKDLSNNVMDILERAKSGEKLSTADSETLKRFVSESRQFVQETTRKPKPPKPPAVPKDKRVRNNVVSFLDAQEQAAKERLRARGIQVSSTPLDVWADYAIIGAAKMGKGTIKFADWSEQMVKDLGEQIRPQLEQLYERAREAYEESTKKVTAQTVSNAERITEKLIRDGKVPAEGVDSLRILAQKVSQLSGESKRIAAQDLQFTLQALEKPSVLKRVSSVQTIGQLLNPKTQVRNALGNELFYRVERMNKLLATPIDIARSKLTGGPRTVTFRTHNQGQYWSNWMRGLKAGWKGINVNGLETQYDLGTPAFKGKYNPLTYLEKALGASLKSFDTAAYMRAYNNTLGEMATLRAINEGQRGNKTLIQKYIREADDHMMKIADEYGKYVTFQDNNVISKGLVAVKRGLNFGKEFGLGDIILKYPKTPGALLMRALEFSPAGFIRSGMILARPLLKKEPNTAEATQALTRAIMGTAGLSGMGYFLLDKGILTGAASKDRDIRELQKSAGQGQYQVNLSALMRFVKSGFDPAAAAIKEGDTLYTYDWMQPVSVAVSLGANVRKNIDEGKSKLSGIAGTAYNSLEGGLNTLTEQSVLQGLRRAAEGYPGQTVTDKIVDILSEVPASFVPTAANQIKQTMDNSRRETYDPNKLKASLNRAQARVPGLSDNLPQQYDTLGQPKETYQDNNAFNVFLNPGFSSKYELSPEAQFITDLINETGDESLAPRAPGKTIRIDGQTIKLSGNEYSRFQQLQGEETRKRISKINPNSRLNIRIRRTEKALNDAGERARNALKKEMGK